MTKPYITKNLPNFQILRVMSRTTEMQTDMKLVNILGLNGQDLPRGCFGIIDGSTLALPKRNRGEQYIVLYTTVHEAIL